MIKTELNLESYNNPQSDQEDVDLVIDFSGFDHINADEKEKLGNLSALELEEFRSVLPLNKPKEIGIVRTDGKSYFINLDSIGKGGSSLVFKGFDLRMGRVVAFKLSHFPDSIISNLIKREAQTQANEVHPNILQVYDCVVSNDTTSDKFEGKSLLIMELINKNEGDVLSSLNEVPPSEMISIVEQLCSAIDYLNQKKERKNRSRVMRSLNRLTRENFLGIIKKLPLEEVSLLHRDIKPKNIIIKKDGTIKLTDFGLSNTARLKSKGVSGTLLYLTPERLKKKKEDVRSELFSLTTIIHELFTKEYFFKGSDGYAVAHNIMEQDYSLVISQKVKIYELCKKYGLDKNKVDAFFKKAWQKDPDDRYQTSEEYLKVFKEAFQTALR